MMVLVAVGGCGVRAGLSRREGWLDDAVVDGGRTHPPNGVGVCERVS